jgi:hypothetical protein
MSYEPIPEDELKQETRSLAPALSDKEATMALLERLPDVAVFGMLLLPDPRHPAAQMLRARWTELHNLTGPRFLLVVFEPAPAWTEGLRDFWQRELGDAFTETWARWQRPIDAGTAYSYLDLFTAPRIKPSELPCLVLFTDPLERRAVVRPLPDWDPESLYRLFVGICETVQECADLPPAERLAALQRGLSAPGARFRAALGHAAERALAYLRQNPAHVAATAIGVVLALASGNVLPLGATVVGVLKALKDMLVKKEGGT